MGGVMNPMQNHIKILRDLKACNEAITWAESHPDMETAWSNCNKSEWMLWLLRNIGYNDRKTLRLFACWCVRNTPLPSGGTVWDLLTDQRSRNAIDVCERFIAGAATKEELHGAKEASRYAVRDYQCDDGGMAVWCAWWAACADHVWIMVEGASRESMMATGDASGWALARVAQSNQLRAMVPYREIESIINGISK
jgi:hypothetical protein